MTDTATTKKRATRAAAGADREPPARDATTATAAPEGTPRHTDARGTGTGPGPGPGTPGTPAPASASATPAASEPVQVASGPVRFRPIGRHRKPRPRKVLFAVGGLALAAGALSFVRLAPESVGGGPGTAEAAPRIEATGDTADTATAAVGASPSGRPGSPGGRGATAATGSASATPVSPVGSGHAATSPSGVALLPAAPGSVSTAPGQRDAPAARTPRPNPKPTDATTPPPPAATTPAAPRPAPSAGTHTPNPPGLCVPLVGLCVKGAASPVR
ncbi:hypothetical protein AB0D78_17425 [Streptomyces avermitilis]|uniref:hypothetical protein n=1 Tax=Streptomyces avermitilis TaxID=33903 RepID=UPI0033EE3A7E